jgi:hypothetical protein
MRLFEPVEHMSAMTVLTGTVSFPDGDYIGAAHLIDSQWKFTRYRLIADNDNVAPPADTSTDKTTP